MPKLKQPAEKHLRYYPEITIQHDYLLEECHNYLLKEIANDPDVELLGTTRNRINMYDSTYGRYLTFRTTPPTRTEIERMIHFGPSYARCGVVPWKKELAKRLTLLDARTMMSIQHILIIANNHDIRILCDRIKADKELLPDALFNEDGDLDVRRSDLVGIHWQQYSAVIINMAAINDVCYHPMETIAAFWTTLLHELRHNSLDTCPYELPWIKEEDKEEESVENWCKIEYARLGDLLTDVNIT